MGTYGTCGMARGPRGQSHTWVGGRCDAVSPNFRIPVPSIFATPPTHAAADAASACRAHMCKCFTTSLPTCVHVYDIVRRDCRTRLLERYPVLLVDGMTTAQVFGTRGAAAVQEAIAREAQEDMYGDG